MRTSIVLIAVFILLNLVSAIAVTAADDTTPPHVSSVDPADGTTGILGNPTITIIFSEPVSTDSTNPLTGTIAMTDGTKDIPFEYVTCYWDTLVFGNYTGPWLAADTEYTITLAGFKDLAGNPMATPYSWSFTTGTDTTPPAVIWTSPADHAIKVPIELGGITVMFSEPVRYHPFGWRQISLKSYGDGAYPDHPFGDITVAGDTLTIPPPAGIYPWFTNWENYFVTVAAVYDIDGNEMVYTDPTSGHTSNYYQFSFKTISTDVTPPEVLSTYPADGADGVSPGVTIRASLSEPVNRCVGDAYLKDSDNNRVELTYPTGPSPHGFDTDDGIILTIGPVHPDLKPGETYTVTLTGLTDGYDNTMPDASWSFTVGRPPVAEAGPERSVILNEPVHFDGSASMDSDGTIVSYAWDFGDGSTGAGATPAHTYTTTGITSVSLTVTDNDGLTGTDTASVTVLSSADAAEDLAGTVHELGLPPDIEAGFDDKLAAAQLQITQGKYTPARSALQAFINQVKAQSGKSLSSAEAGDLIARAQRIILTIPGK